MTIKEICKLLKAIEASTISEFHLGDLKIVRSSPTKDVGLTPDYAQTIEQSAIAESITHEAFSQDLQTLQKTELEDMLLEDPSEYERRLAAGELEEDESASRH